MKRELKVGMRVAVYGKTGNFLPIRKTGTIEAIVNGLIRFDSSVDPELRGKFDPHTGGWDLTLVHPKQVVPIRLVKKKRRSVWIVRDPKCTVNIVGIKTSEQLLDYLEMRGNPEDYIEFREVKRK